MKFTYLYRLAFLILSSILFTKPLSDNASISIITCGSGLDLYTKYGHNAIRIYDPQYNINTVYDFGIFDFNTPQFYLKFIQKKLDYRVDKSNYKRFKYKYLQSKRDFKEQYLNLNTNEIQLIANLLEENYKPENRFYRYDFLTDNCSSKIRDVLSNTLANKIYFPDSSDSKSFRQHLNAYNPISTWIGFGMNLIMGLEADKMANSTDYMFLPDGVFTVLSETEINRDGQTEPLVNNTETKIFERINLDDSTSIFIIFWSLFIIIFLLTYLELSGYLHNLNILDSFIFGISGLLGVIFLLLWIVSDHPIFSMNLNVLWALPTHLVVAVFLLIKKPMCKSYWKYTSILLFIVLAGWPFSPQELPAPLYPFLMILFIRILMQYRKISMELSN